MGLFRAPDSIVSHWTTHTPRGIWWPGFQNARGIGTTVEEINPLGVRASVMGRNPRIRQTHAILWSEIVAPNTKVHARGGSRGTTNSGMYVDLDLAAFGDINNRQKREPPFSTSTSEEPGKTCNCTRDTHMARVLSLLAVVAVDTHTHHNETAFKTKHSGTARERDSERQAPLVLISFFM